MWNHWRSFTCVRESLIGFMNYSRVSTILNRDYWLNWFVLWNSYGKWHFLSQMNEKWCDLPSLIARSCHWIQAQGASPHLEYFITFVFRGTIIEIAHVFQHALINVTNRTRYINNPLHIRLHSFSIALKNMNAARVFYVAFAAFSSLHVSYLVSNNILICNLVLSEFF